MCLAKNQFQLALEFLDYGACVDYLDSNGCNLFHVLMTKFYVDIELVQALGKKLINRLDPNQLDHKSRSPLHYAIKYNDLEAFNFAKNT